MDNSDLPSLHAFDFLGVVSSKSVTRWNPWSGSAAVAEPTVGDLRAVPAPAPRRPRRAIRAVGSLSVGHR